ncbi:SMI1/KNR4 family protein [Kordia sp.]|uniref:SMI1/KNR4 family protein n=1 Tax=Kordia sp. TaxID=1965332 RepID=UPI003B5AF729
MKITFMQKLEEYLIKNDIKDSSGIPITEIEKFEQKLNIQFPKAYKEYSLLAGKGFRPISVSGLSIGLFYLEELYELAKANLKEYNLEHLINKDFWVIGEIYGSLYINFIYLDEGDDPPVYGLDMENYEDDPKEAFGKIADSFSEYVEQAIDDYDPKYDR